MAYHCPDCQEARVTYVGTTEDAKTSLRCELCGHAWLHGGEARQVAAGRQLPQTIGQARSRFPTPDAVSPEARRRVERLKAQFLVDRPAPLAEVADFWPRYQRDLQRGRPDGGRAG